MAIDRSVQLVDRGREVGEEGGIAVVAVAEGPRRCLGLGEVALDARVVT